MERDIEQVRQELQVAREQMQTFQKESKSTNEELQMLSAELQHKVEDLSRLTNDQKNLLEATEIATLFLDPALRVRLFTAGASRVFKLIPGDVGRAITNIASELAYRTGRPCVRGAADAGRARATGCRTRWELVSGADQALSHSGKHD